MNAPMEVDDQILRLHHQGFVTGAIAIRLSVESSYVRSVVHTHLQRVAEASKPQYDRTRRKRSAREKVARARLAVEKAAAALAELERS
jgi:hypothetical protein